MTWYINMPPQRCSLHGQNRDAPHYKNVDGESLPPPLPFYDGVHFALAQFMVETDVSFKVLASA